VSASALRIVHTESSLGWGGQEIRVLAESQGLIRRGHQVTLLCPPEARIHLEAANWGVPVVALPIGQKRPVGLGALMQWFGANTCDAINTHSSTDSWLTALARLALRQTTPMVRTRHISAAVPRDPLTRWLYTRAASRIVTTGEALKRQLVSRNGFPEAMIESVPTGIDAGRFRPGGEGGRAAARARLGLPQDRVLVGILATLRSWKGHGYLIEALKLLDSRISLVIVGDGPTRVTLEKQVIDLGLQGRVLFAGDQSNVLPWLQALDVFALPSYANEGVPQALVQAMMVGLACVTTPIGAIGEVAENERTAIMVPPRDAAALAAAIAGLAADEGRRIELGAAARKRCVEEYSLERMLDRMEKVLREVSGHGSER